MAKGQPSLAFFTNHQNMKTTLLWMCLLGLTLQMHAQSLTTPTQVLDHYFESIGGKSSAQAVTSFTLSGTTTLTRMSQKMVLDFEQGTKVGQGYYHQIAMKGRVMSRTIFQGQKLSEDGRVRTLSGDDLASQLAQTQLIPELLYLTDGYALTMVGTTSTNGGNAYHLRATKGSTTIDLYYNVATGRKVREDQTTASPKGKQTTRAAFSDYQKVGALTLPHTIKTEVQNGSALIETTYSRIQLNASIDASQLSIR